MSVLDRSALSDSPLADLHAIASELSIDGYRRLRRPELIDSILVRQGSEDAGATDDVAARDRDDTAARDRNDTDGEESSSRRRRGRRGGRGRAAQDGADASAKDDFGADPSAESAPARVEDETHADVAAQTPRRRRGARTNGKTADQEQPAPAADADADADAQGHESDAVEGVVELLANGSGFVRPAGVDASDDDVYISAAQVKRCELVTGDRVTGPKRAPRRSERYASMIRIETINGRPASELADNLRFDDLPATLPTERIVIGSEDPTLEAIEWLTPFGRGSRVTIVGGPRAGKTETLRRLATALAGSEDLTVLVALAGVRPEEIYEYTNDPGPAGAPAAAVSFAASHDAAAAAVEPVIDQARRLAARGADAVVLLDTLDGVSPHTARKIMASARNIVDGGSVTIVATAGAPIGGETTVITLDAVLAGAGRFPALDLLASGTLRPELLVGDAGAEAIAKTRSEVMNGEDVDED
jgi:transcription termination factor Rho